jgi:hypothetical protein
MTLMSLLHKTARHLSATRAARLACVKETRLALRSYKPVCLRSTKLNSSL